MLLFPKVTSATYLACTHQYFNGTFAKIYLFSTLDEANAYGVVIVIVFESDGRVGELAETLGSQAVTQNRTRDGPYVSMGRELKELVGCLYRIEPVHNHRLYITSQSGIILLSNIPVFVQTPPKQALKLRWYVVPSSALITIVAY